MHKGTKWQTGWLGQYKNTHDKCTQGLTEWVAGWLARKKGGRWRVEDGLDNGKKLQGAGQGRGWGRTFSLVCVTSPSCVCVSPAACARRPSVFIMTAITFSCTHRMRMRSGCWKKMWLLTRVLLSKRAEMRMRRRKRMMRGERKRKKRGKSSRRKCKLHGSKVIFYMKFQYKYDSWAFFLCFSFYLLLNQLIMQ